MDIKYCLPIIKDSKKEVLQMINTNLSDYSYFEIWLDYLQDLDTEFIDLLISQYEEKLVFLFRRQNLEGIKMPQDKREKIIWQIANTKAFLDLDISQETELNYIKDKNIKLSLILSYHNYEETPAFPQMIDMIGEMDKYNPKVYKFSTLCNDEKDTVKLFNLLMYLKEEDKKFIIMGMGENGILTRIAGALWGNEMNFAPISKENASAPGQLAREEFEEILGVINGR